ncbi:transcriptional regulator, TetR family [Thiothrix caldifontis]|uniref:Transcriptional regulator, TetR family n=1 Tax=Thiothrix caldifontis TaxID=525918 RepID=A0A1H4G7M5_9GAMM|nr:TetR family transcriptional regulator [Thiothrix caldifontis]SEB05447.1 transcriptional regulator, TetR family [Thiothrix caldifontis]
MQIRATNPEDKEQRREAILDAAEQQWLAQPERITNVAEIAAAAGVAKGTVYLYFRSKEELFLAIHERHVTEFFNRVAQRALQDTPMVMGDMFAIKRQFLLDTPIFLPLATQCHGMMEKHIPLEVGYAFEERTYARLNTTVTALQRHFPLINQALMLQSYALILGLWQLLRPTPLKELMKERSLICACTNDYLLMLENALTALWRGALTPENP